MRRRSVQFRVPLESSQNNNTTFLQPPPQQPKQQQNQQQIVATQDEAAKALATRIQGLAARRSGRAVSSVKSRGMQKVFGALADLAEMDRARRGLEPAPRLYGGSTSRPSRYSQGK